MRIIGMRSVLKGPVVADSYNSGLEQGQQQGELKTKQALARKLLAKQFAPEEVAALTELSIEEVMAITRAKE